MVALLIDIFLDSLARKNFISNAYSLVSMTKGKNIIISSGAMKSLELRGPFDIINMCTLFSLAPDQARDALSKECKKAILHGGFKEFLTINTVIFSNKM